MNCFEARQAFVSFWQRTMPLEQRAAFTAHLRGCQRCDRSFRAFALSAPVLHSGGEAMAGAAPSRAGTLHGVAARTLERAAAREGFAARSWRAISVSGAIAAAAILAVYIAAAPSHDTLEQTITGDDSGVELISFTAGDLLGQDIPGQDSNHALVPEAPLNLRDDLAG